jgi:hypothetical protein
MSVITNRRINQADLDRELPGGYSWRGGRLEDPVQKEIIGVDVTDEQVQAAIDAAAGVYVNLQANRQTIMASARAALGNNRDYLAIGSPTQAQVRDQVAALTRQNNGLIRVLINDLTDTT